MTKPQNLPVLYLVEYTIFQYRHFGQTLTCFKNRSIQQGIHGHGYPASTRLNEHKKTKKQPCYIASIYCEKNHDTKERHK